jgi:hypothetical protein
MVEGVTCELRRLIRISSLTLVCALINFKMLVLVLPLVQLLRFFSTSARLALI